MSHQVIWRWYTGRWWVDCYIWYSEEGTGRGPSPPRPLLAVPNVTAHPSTASVPIIVLQYNGPLLCGVNMGIIGLTHCCMDPSQNFLKMSTMSTDTSRDGNATHWFLQQLNCPAFSIWVTVSFNCARSHCYVPGFGGNATAFVSWVELIS